MRSIPALSLVVVTFLGFSLRAVLAGSDGPRASPLSRGGGVTVAVVGTDRSLQRAIARAAPECGVVFTESIDEALAASSPLASVRVVLLAASEAEEDPETSAAIARAVESGVVVVAPAGDEGLSHERFPAGTRGVVGVAALASSGLGRPRLALKTNAGARTSVAAEGRDSFEAAAAVAAASALAFAFDPSLTADEVRRALAAGETVTREAPRGAAPARLDVPALLERLRPRSRALVVRDVRVLPRLVPRGEPARLRLRATAVGRLPARGPLVAKISSVAGARTADDPALRELELPFGVLVPGESVELEAAFVPHSARAGAARPTVDGGVVRAVPLVAAVRGPGVSASAALDLVAPGDRVPGLSIVEVHCERGLRVRVVVESTSPLLERDVRVRLAVSETETLAEGVVPTLAPGERASVELRGTELRGMVGPARARGALAVFVEVVRSPTGFRATSHDRWPLAIDARGAAPRRRSSRR